MSASSDFLPWDWAEIERALVLAIRNEMGREEKRLLIRTLRKVRAYKNRNNTLGALLDRKAELSESRLRARLHA